MYLENESFDAIITDKNGVTWEVDCCITEPTASGLPASICIEVPMGKEEKVVLENPCSLRGSDSGLEIEIKDLWYRSISIGATRRKYARGQFHILHAGQLRVKRSHWIWEQARLRFLLSPVRFFKDQSKSAMVSYTATPKMEVELFKLCVPVLGMIRFIKFWSVRNVDTREVAAEVRASFAAEIVPSQTNQIDDLVKAMRDVLTPLSILTRQAITLHGWQWEKQDGLETMWFDPVEPNFAPDMAEEPATDLCFPKEFETSAQALVEKFNRATSGTQEAVTSLSVALAPHVRRSTEGNLSALFGALEEVVALDKMTKEERMRLRETDPEVIAALLETKLRIESAGNPKAASVAARLEGLAKSVPGSGPSLNARLEKFKAAHPAFSVCMSDLWPLQGSDMKPGLKQIRDSLAHGLTGVYSTQAIAVAHWHFARLAERLAFILLGVEVPKGLQHNSFLLRREHWYDRGRWESIRAAAKRSS